MHPGLARIGAAAAEAFDTDRQVGMAQPPRRALEVAVVLDQRPIDVPTGIEQHRGQNLRIFNSNGREQSDPGPHFAAAAPERFNSAERWAVLETDNVQRLVIALGRYQLRTPQLDLAERC